MSESLPLWHLGTEFPQRNMSSQVPAFLHFVYVTLVTSHLLHTGCNGSRHYFSPGRVILYRSVATTSTDGYNQHHNWNDRPIRWPDREQPEPHKYALHNRDDGILFRWNYNDNRPIHSTALHGENQHYSPPFLSYTEYEQTKTRRPTGYPVNSEHRFGDQQIVHHLHHHHHYYDTSVNPLKANFWHKENLSHPIEPDILYKHILQLSKSHPENNQQSSNVALQTATVMPRSKEKTNITPEIPPFRPSPQLNQFSEPDPLFHPNKSVFLTHPTPMTTQSPAGITTEKPTMNKVFPDSINAQLPPSESHIDTIIPYVSAAAATASKASATSTTQGIPYMLNEERYITDALSTTMQSTVETTTAGNGVMEHKLMFQPPNVPSSESLYPQYSNSSDSSQQVAMPTASSALQLNSLQQNIIRQNNGTETQDDTVLTAALSALSQTEYDTSANKTDYVSVIHNSENNDNQKGSENTVTILHKVNTESGNNVPIITEAKMQNSVVTMENTELSRHHLIPHVIQKDNSSLKVTADFTSISHVDTDMDKRKPTETIFIAPQMTYQHEMAIAHKSTEKNEDLTTLHPTITDYQNEDKTRKKTELYDEVHQETN